MATCPIKSNDGSIRCDECIQHCELRNPASYPEVDPLVKALIKNLQQCSQVQYSTTDQLKYLVDVAHKLGLYDAADLIKTTFLDIKPTIFK
jgi:hypothetical protein